MQRQVSGDQMMMKGFGERLRLLRLAYKERYGAEHHTKARWAERLWVSPAMYGRWEGGNHLPKFVDLLRISLLFQVDPNYLVAGVLSDRLAPWLYHALKVANPQLLDVADYWKNQSELFERANQVPEDGEDNDGQPQQDKADPDDPGNSQPTGKRSSESSRGFPPKRASKRGTVARHN